MCLGGLAMGITFSAVPIYIVEIASLELRGPLGTLSQVHETTNSNDVNLNLFFYLFITCIVSIHCGSFNEFHNGLLI